MALVLVACEMSQRVTKAFRDLGHEAYSCDLVDTIGGHKEWHFKADALEIANSYKWDLIIAHPPCTFLTSSSACRLFDSDHRIKDLDRLKRGIEASQFFLKFLSLDCPMICVENPAPLKIFCLPPYQQIIEPYYFGEPYKKRTCLWLRGLPRLVPTNIVSPTSCWTVQGGGESCRIKLKGGHGAKNQMERSLTFNGVASAMASQWGSLLHV